MKLKGGPRKKTTKNAVIKSSLRKAPLTEEGKSKAKKGARCRRSRRSTLVSHAKNHHRSYPPRDEMHQRILKKIAESSSRLEAD